MYYGFWKQVNYCVRRRRTHTNPFPQVIPISRSECHAISRFGHHIRLAGAFGFDLMWSYSLPRGSWLCLKLLERLKFIFPMQLLKRRKFVIHENNLRGESICPISEVKRLTCCLYSIKCIFKCHLRGKTYLLSMSSSLIS